MRDRPPPEDFFFFKFLQLEATESESSGGFVKDDVGARFNV